MRVLLALMSVDRGLEASPRHHRVVHDPHGTVRLNHLVLTHHGVPFPLFPGGLLVTRGRGVYTVGIGIVTGLRIRVQMWYSLHIVVYYVILLLKRGQPKN